MALRLLELDPLGFPVLGSAVLGLLFTYLAVSTFLSWFRLRKFKGPLLASFSYLWLARASYSGDAVAYYMDARKKAGSPLVRVAPDTLLTDDPDVIRQINAARAGYNRGQWYDSFRLDPYHHNMFSTRDLSYHDDIKSRTSAGYSGREVPTLERDVDGKISDLKNLIRSKYLSQGQDTRPLDFSFASHYFTLDSLSTIAYGKPFGFLAKDGDVDEFIQRGKETFPFVSVCSMVPTLNSFFFSNFWLSVAGPRETDSKGFGRLMAVSRKVVAPRFGPDGPKEDQKQQRDMLGSFIRHGLTRRQCEAEVLLQILAGSDSTSNVVRSTMLAVTSCPRVYSRLQEEIDQAIDSGAISSPITVAEAKTLPYLQAVIMEGIRHHPPVIGFNTKIVPPQGDTLAGMFVPGGTKVAVNPFALMRHEPTFGTDIEMFRPERWTEATPDERLNMQRTAELAFGHGRFMCAGKMVAFMELNKIYVELLRDFDFQIVNIRQPCKEVLYTLYLMDNLILRVTARDRQGSQKASIKEG